LRDAHRDHRATIAGAVHFTFNRPGSIRMILELADIRIKPGTQEAFDAAIKKGVETVIAKAKGFRGYQVHKGVESADRYILMIYWDTVENHTVDFRGSAAFPEWRGHVGSFFAGPPFVEHFTLLSKSA
jgi:heme-degrading monooxygenase HmoA